MKKFTAFCLMFFIGVIPAIPLERSAVVLENIQDNDQNKSDREAKREAALKAKTELLGLGADIKVVMRKTNLRGEHIRHRGIIDEISADGFGLKAKDETLRIQYSQIDRLLLAKNKYKANGQVDPVKVRQVAAELGIGKGIQLKLISDRKMKGEIQSLTSDSLVIADLKKGQIETVPFDDIKEIKGKGMPAWGKALIIGGAVFGALIVVAAVYVAGVRGN